MEKNKKRIFMATLIFTLCIFVTPNVHAKETPYFTNSNGVSLTEAEYNYIKELYSENYLNMITMDVYNDLVDNGFMFQPITKKSSDDVEKNVNAAIGISPLSDYHETSSKKLTISKSCSDNCKIVVKLTWNVVPSVKSYDVMGAYLWNTSRVSNVITSTSSTANGYSIIEIKEQSKGFGASFEIPSSGTNYETIQQYTVTPGGSVLASYQHAVSKVSEATSKSYNIGINGAGNVFEFYGSAVDKYDQMHGVDIDV